MIGLTTGVTINYYYLENGNNKRLFDKFDASRVKRISSAIGLMRAKIDSTLVFRNGNFEVPLLLIEPVFDNDVIEIFDKPIAQQRFPELFTIDKLIAQVNRIRALLEEYETLHSELEKEIAFLERTLAAAEEELRQARIASGALSDDPIINALEGIDVRGTIAILRYFIVVNGDAIPIFPGESIDLLTSQEEIFLSITNIGTAPANYANGASSNIEVLSGPVGSGTINPGQTVDLPMAVVAAGTATISLDIDNVKQEFDITLIIPSMQIRSGGNIYNHNEEDNAGLEYATGFIASYFVSAGSSSALILGPNAVSIQSEVNCSVIIQQQPAEEVEASEEEEFVLHIDPDEEGEFSFAIQVNNNSPDNPFILNVVGTAVLDTVLVVENVEITEVNDLEVGSFDDVINNLVLENYAVGIMVSQLEVPEIVQVEDAFILTGPGTTLESKASLIVDFPRGVSQAYTTNNGTTLSGDTDEARSISCEKAPGGRRSRFNDNSSGQTWQNNPTDDILGAGVVRHTDSSSFNGGTGNSTPTDFFSQTKYWVLWHGRLGGTSTDIVGEFFRSDNNNGRLDFKYQPSTGTLRITVHDGSSAVNRDFVVGDGIHKIGVYYDGTDLRIWIDNDPFILYSGTGNLGSLSASTRILRGAADKVIDLSAVWIGKEDLNNISQHIDDMEDWLAAR